MKNRNIFLWILYDFANSIVIISFFLYLSQWLVIDAHLSSFWFNSIFVGSTILLLFSAPIFAEISDRIQKRKLFLNITTVGVFIFCGLTAIVASWGIQYVWWVALLYLISQYFYQFSFVFYNPMIDQLAPLGQRGKISGWGQTANWIGQIVGILIALPFAASGRIAPLFPCVIIFFLLALPMMIFFRESYPETLVKRERSKTGFILRFYEFMRHLPAAIFLLAFFFFNDAILTLSNNFPIYMERVFFLADKTKSLLLLTILATSAIGAFVAGQWGDKIGLKKTMKIILVAWIIIIPLVSVTTSFSIFTALTVIVGLLYGAIWSVTRAYLSGILPESGMVYGFSFYTLMERFATFAGPLSWGLIVSFFGETSVLGYRIAVFAMTIFVIIGYIFIRRSQDFDTILE